MNDNDKNKLKLDKLKPQTITSIHYMKIGYFFLGVTATMYFFINPLLKKYWKRNFDNNATVTHICWFDLETDNKYIGRLDIGLYGNIAPKSINNFLSLSDLNSSIGFNYKNSLVFRLIPKYIICMGDVRNNDGTGHYSIYGNDFIEDSFDKSLTFNNPGVVGLCNKGKNTNGSSFFITLDDIPKINEKYTIIGEVIEGLEMLKETSVTLGNVDGNVDGEVKISDCGVYIYDEYMKRKDNKRRKL